MSVADRQQAVAKAVTHLASLPFYTSLQHVGCYQAVRDEMDTSLLLDRLQQDGKTVYLPRLQADRSLVFYVYAAGDALVLNQYGIPEPALTSPACPSDQMDLVLLPLIAFDAAGRRLGTGGGYYDRTFAWLKASKRPAKPLLWGWAYACQQAEHLPSDDWDVLLDGVVTDNQ